MTAQQKATIDTVKAWAFPALLTVVIYFLSQVMDSLERMEERLDELYVNQRVIQNELSHLKLDTTDIRADVEALKKSLEIEYKYLEDHAR